MHLPLHFMLKLMKEWKLLKRYGQLGVVSAVISLVYIETFQLVGAAILEPSTTYLPRWVAPLAASGAATDAFTLTLVAPLAANSASPNPTILRVPYGQTYAGSSEVADTTC